MVRWVVTWRRVLGVVVVVELAALLVVASVAAAPFRWPVEVRAASRGALRGADLEVPWRFGVHGPGEYAPLLHIDSSVYPNDKGVTFWILPVDGPLFEDRTDIRGPELFGDEFHARRRVWSSGDRVQGVWTDRSGRGWTASGFVR